MIGMPLSVQHQHQPRSPSQLGGRGGGSVLGARLHRGTGFQDLLHLAAAKPTSSNIGAGGGATTKALAAKSVIDQLQKQQEQPPQNKQQQELPARFRHHDERVGWDESADGSFVKAFEGRMATEISIASGDRRADAAAHGLLADSLTMMARECLTRLPPPPSCSSSSPSRRANDGNAAKRISGCIAVLADGEEEAGNGGCRCLAIKYVQPIKIWSTSSSSSTGSSADKDQLLPLIVIEYARAPSIHDAENFLLLSSPSNNIAIVNNAVTQLRLGAEEFGALRKHIEYNATGYGKQDPYSGLVSYQSVLSPTLSSSS